MQRIGIAGIGNMGRTHLFNLLKSRNVELIGIADGNKNSRSFAKNLGVKKVFSDYNELFKEPDLDAIVISLPNFLKKESVVAASEKGLDILLDKPLARNYSEALEMKEVVEKNGSRLMIASNTRYHPHIKKMKKIIENGEIGDSLITTMELVNHGPFSHPLYPKPVAEWWFDKELNGGGALLDLGWHLIDVFNWFFGDSNVENVIFQNHFNLDFEDGANITLRSCNGGVGVINVGWFSHAIFPRVDFRVISHGTMGYCSTDDLKPNFYLNAATEALINLKRRIFLQPINILTYSYYFSSFYEVLTDFVNCLETDTEFPVKLDQELRVQKIIQDSYIKFENEKKKMGVV